MINNNITHGLTKSRIYSIFKGMNKRCFCETDKAYSSYGGRGIKVIWESFENFYKDMGISYKIHLELYGIKNTTIDRIDVNGNYCKENCRWATIKEQARNKRIKIKKKKEIICPKCNFCF